MADDFLPNPFLDSFAVSNQESSDPPPPPRWRISSAESMASSCGSVVLRFHDDDDDDGGGGDDGRAADESSLQTLVGFAEGLVTKAVLFQLDLLISCLALPIWALRCSLLLIFSPFGVLRVVMNVVIESLLRISKGLVDRISLMAYKKLQSQKQLGVRLVWGIFWSFYVFLVLVGILVMAFVAGSMAMRQVVEEPVVVVKDLNFDYTKASPNAVVALGVWNDAFEGLDGGGKGGVGKYDGRRFVPQNHKLELTVSLTLPESDYNRKLGVFQVRADFLSMQGQVMYSLTHPCMLYFKSSPIRYLETTFKSFYLLLGYSLEAQIVSLRMRGFTEGTVPTTWIRITLEQRADSMAGAGIPEIYAASLTVESELPLLKRTIWNWRWTLFIWVAMGFFTLELLVMLVCCRPVMILRTRPRQFFDKNMFLQGRPARLSKS